MDLVVFSNYLGYMAFYLRNSYTWTEHVYRLSLTGLAAHTRKAYENPYLTQTTQALVWKDKKKKDMRKYFSQLKKQQYQEEK